MEVRKNMEIYFKSKIGNFNAKGNYEKEKVTVIKESIISDKKYNSKLSKKILQLRNDNTIVKDNKVIKNVEFKSLTSAAQFVCGYRANGLRVWRNKDGNKIERK